ncbi:MAG TPA: antibiotic biosynthesis monooxygenase [Pilimelia sp.]|nr:antibiotic biosynthesis monooxygenase [Pilimelia sp.]
MIARVWKGWTRPEEADRYDRHYRSEVLSTLRQVAGFRGARLLRRAADTEIEFVSVTFFDDLDAVRAFAGEDYETAVVTGVARQALVRYEERVLHYDVAFDA